MKYFFWFRLRQANQVKGAAVQVTISVGFAGLIPVTEIIFDNPGVVKDQRRQGVTGKDLGLQGIVRPERIACCSGDENR